MDSIKCKETIETKAEDISDKKLDETLSEGYGIFSGSNIQWVTLKFTPERARWVSSEKWHPKQEGQFLDDGSYLLKFPYSKDTELIMDIMKYFQPQINKSDKKLQRNFMRLYALQPE